MIKLKTPSEIEKMRRAGRVAGLALQAGGGALRPGVTTAEIDRVVRGTIESFGAKPSFLKYRGFPKSCCVSLNREVIHGIPGGRKLVAGDLVSIDVGAQLDGFHGDTAATFFVGAPPSAAAQKLVDVTRACFFQAFAAARLGSRVSDLSNAVQTHAEQNGFGVVREWTGHGVGRTLHEDPDIPNYNIGKRGSRLLAGMTIAVEPMIMGGKHGKTKVLKDGWTVVTADNSLSAHYEHTILVTNGEPELLTMVEE